MLYAIAGGDRCAGSRALSDPAAILAIKVDVAKP
jgi:hypothetical protein